MLRTPMLGEFMGTLMMILLGDGVVGGDLFEPLAAPLMKITARIKASFDPDAILNPGRMYAGI